MIPEMGVAIVMAGSLPSRLESVKTRVAAPNCETVGVPPR
jgi:hypothetical protein